MKSIKMPFNSKISMAILTIIFTILTDKSNAQCGIQTINDTFISCGNSMQLKTIPLWQNKTPGGSANYVASYFTTKDIGYFTTYDGNIIKTINGGTSFNTQFSGTSEPLNSIFFANDSTGYAAGGNWGSSVFIKTTNGGANWSKLPTGQANSIQSIFFTSKDTGFAVGGNNLTFDYFILKTNNGGNTWSKIDSGTSFTLLSVYFVNNRLGFATGSHGKILRTNDGGNVWSLVNSGTTNNITSLYFIDSINGYAVSANTLLKTNNAGISWQTKTISGTYNFISVYFTDTNNGFLIDNYSYFITNDAGTTWTSNPIGSTNTITTASFIDQNTLYVGGSMGTIRKLQNPISYSWFPNTFLSNATTQNPYVSPKDSVYYFVTATFEGNCIAKDSVYISVRPLIASITPEKTIVCGIGIPLSLQYTNYQNPIPLKYTWWPSTGLSDSTLAEPLAQPVVTTKYYFKIETHNGCSKIDSTDIYVTPMKVSAGSDKFFYCGDSAQLIGSSNWIPQTLSGFYLYDLHFTSPEVGYALSNGILKTLDAGNTWTQKIYVGVILNDLYFYNNNLGFAVGENGTIVKTSNAGSNWQINYATSNNLRAIFFTSEDTGYVVGSSGTVRKTTDGGSTWISQNIGINTQLNNVFFIDANTGFIIGNGGLMRKTINGGSTWTSISSGTTNDLFGITKSDQNTIHIIGYNRTYLKSTDAGSTFISQPITAFYDARSIVFTSSQIGYMAGRSGAIGGIAKTMDGGLTWNLQEYSDLTEVTALSLPNSSSGFALGNGQNRVLLSMPPTPDSYTWTPNIGLNNPTFSSPIARPNQTISYNLSINTKGCEASDSVKVYVYPLLITNLQDYVYNPTYTCGSTHQLDTVKSYTPSSLIRYKWTPTTGLNDSASSHPIVTLKSTIKYTLTATTSNGCYAEDSITIYAAPFVANASEDLNRSPQNICGSKYHLDTVKTNAIENNIKYHWYPNFRINDTTSNNPTITLYDDITYYVVVSTPSGCSAMDSIHIQPFPLLIDPGQDKEAYCGTLTQLDSVRTNQNDIGPYTYSWFPTIGLNQSNIPNPTSSLANQTYTVTVTNKEGCVANDSIYLTRVPMVAPELCMVSVDSTNHNFIIWDMSKNSSVVSYFLYKETNITDQFNLLASIPAHDLNYFVDSNSQPQVQSNRYRISSIDSCGLQTQQGKPHKTIHLSINKGTGNTWNLIWNQYEGFIANTYNIYRGTDSSNLVQIGTTAGTSNSYTDLTAPSSDVYYQVEIISPSPCALQKTLNSSKSNKMSNKFNGVEESENGLPISIYPNPTNDLVNIIWVSDEQLAKIKLYNLQGIKLLEKELTPTANTIDVNGYGIGIYLIEITTNKGIGRKYLVKI